MRLIDHLHTMGLSGRVAKSALASGKVWYRDAPTADAAREVEPKLVRYLPSAPSITVGRDLAVVYRDDDVVVIWKPAGLLAVPAAGRHGERSVIGVVSHIQHTRAYAVHRLDELTSGLMAVARTEEAQRRMRNLFAEHAIERRYLAIVRGMFPREPLTRRSLLGRDRGDGLRGSTDDTDDPSAKEAITTFRLVEQLGRHAALVEAQLETGRTHQVRIQLAELGHPVLGDDLYGGQAIGRSMRRYALHAYVLGFVQPLTGRQLRFEAPLADDLEQYVRHSALRSIDRQ